VGVKVGGHRIPEETKRMAKTLMADKNLSVKQICERLGIAKSTLYKYVGLGTQNP
jgi:predicted DNA-binding transcriptional regulator AlpA